MLRPFRAVLPAVHPTAYVDVSAQVIGDVHLGAESSVWMNAVIRGDVNAIRIGARTNVQDNCTIHVGHIDSPTIIHEEVTIGHGAIVHGCTVHRGALIGMGSRVLDKAVIGENALIGAGALVPEGMIVPPRMLVVGVPARVKRPLTDEEVARLEESWRLYVEYKNNYLNQR